MEERAQFLADVEMMEINNKESDVPPLLLLQLLLLHFAKGVDQNLINLVDQNHPINLVMNNCERLLQNIDKIILNSTASQL